MEDRVRKKWYRSAVVKAILTPLCIISLAGVIIFGIWVSTVGFNLGNVSFEESDDLKEMLKSAMSMIKEMDNLEPQYDEEIISSIRYNFDEDNTNLKYLLYSGNSDELYTNVSGLSNADIESSVEELISADNVLYIVVTPYLKEFESNMDVNGDEFYYLIYGSAIEDPSGVFAIALDTEYPIQDEFYSAKIMYDKNLVYDRIICLSGIASIFVCIIATIWMTVISGRNPFNEEIKLNKFDRWKTEIAAIAMIVLGCIALLILIPEWISFNLSNTWSWNSTDWVFSIVYGLSTLSIAVEQLWFLGVAAAGFSATFYLGYFSLVRRIKADALWKNSIAYAIVSFISKTAKNISFTARSLAALGCLLLLHWLCAMRLAWYPFFVILCIIADIAAFYFTVNKAIAKGKIQKAMDSFAAGDISYTIDLSELRGEERETARMINELGEGLNIAVENAKKSERLKTDLITNVAHDIKTPLTSIINYTELLKSMDIKDEKMRKYVDILAEKAQRLKVLTEDVVESSKVSSGALKLDMADMDFAEMLRQAEGEFKEKFEALDLTPITELPDSPVIIHADGRQMWRVIENLYNNVEKYAMPGTRVYIALKTDDEEIIFSLKNISKQQLNFSAEELTERFIRGDVSRSSEGSGLGLSIAKSLIKMQEGEMKIYLDGDLFKVEIVFQKRTACGA